MGSAGIEHLVLAIPRRRRTVLAGVDHRLTAGRHPEASPAVDRHAAGVRPTLWPVNRRPAVLRHTHWRLLVVTSLGHTTLWEPALNPSRLRLWESSLREIHRWLLVAAVRSTGSDRLGRVGELQPRLDGSVGGVADRDLLARLLASTVERSRHVHFAHLVAIPARSRGVGAWRLVARWRVFEHEARAQLSVILLSQRHLSTGIALC